MKLRLECYASEFPAADAAIKSAFPGASCGKAYPNARGMAGTPCEERHYYDKLQAPAVSAKDAMTLGMIRFLAAVSDGYGVDVSGELGRLRELHDMTGLTDAQRAELLAEWQARIVLGLAKGGGA